MNARQIIDILWNDNSIVIYRKFRGAYRHMLRSGEMAALVAYDRKRPDYIFTNWVFDSEKNSFFIG